MILHLTCDIYTPKQGAKGGLDIWTTYSSSSYNSKASLMALVMCEIDCAISSISVENISVYIFWILWLQVVYIYIYNQSQILLFFNNFFKK
jgi:hypothetical protein